MTDSLTRLLERIRDESQPQPCDLVIQIRSARKCLETACRRLEFPAYSHHDFRHFFATTCIEAGVDIPTVSRWLGHKDGGRSRCGFMGTCVRNILSAKSHS